MREKILSFFQSSCSDTNITGMLVLDKAMFVDKISTYWAPKVVNDVFVFVFIVSARDINFFPDNANFCTQDVWEQDNNLSSFRILGSP